MKKRNKILLWHLAYHIPRALLLATLFSLVIVGWTIGLFYNWGEVIR